MHAPVWYIDCPLQKFKMRYSLVKAHTIYLSKYIYIIYRLHIGAWTLGVKVSVVMGSGQYQLVWVATATQHRTSQNSKAHAGLDLDLQRYG